MAYDDQNVFAKILRGEIPCNKVYEDEFALAFHDIKPAAPVHVLVIPKSNYVSLADFGAQASPYLVHGFFQAVAKVAARIVTRRCRISTCIFWVEGRWGRCW
jgi:diadenosine tetraphosphate (Ap4A) HIT family hydrolase